MLCEGKAISHPPLYWEFHEGGHSRALRDGDWKLVKARADTLAELYNLADDPAEAHDIAADHPDILAQTAISLQLVEVHREDIATLPSLLDLMKDTPHRIILFCDDLSFDHDDTAYKSLKAALDGGIEGRPDNVLFYATSNRRHLLPRHMMENEQSTAINPSEAVEEKVSLSDRFGLWLGFHKCSQDDYLTMIDGYAAHFGLPLSREDLHREALEWATTRGGRSGRVAWQYIQDVAGRLRISTNHP